MTIVEFVLTYQSEEVAKEIRAMRAEAREEC